MKRILPIFLGVLGLVPIFLVLFQPRSFNQLAHEVALSGSSDDLGFMRRAATLLIFLVTMLLFVWVAFRNNFRIGLYFLLPITFLWLGAIGSMLFSIQPAFSFSYFTSLTVLTFVAVVGRYIDLCDLIAIGKKIALVYVWGSLLAMIVAPQWALEREYLQGYIPGLSFRLHGLGIHANQTAIFAWLFIVLELANPDKNRVMRIVHLVASISVILLTQSKTAWILFLWSYILWILLNKPLRSLLFIGLALLVALIAALSLSFLGETPASLVEGMLVKTPEGLLTLTGRVYIWQMTVYILQDNLLFGYGPNLWSEEMAMEYASLLGWMVYQSHNQYIQSLGEGGVWGLVMFLMYSFWVLGLAMSSRKVMGGLGLVLFSSFLLRGLTEVWFGKPVTDGHLFFHTIILAIIFASYKVVKFDSYEMMNRKFYKNKFKQEVVYV